MVRRSVVSGEVLAVLHLHLWWFYYLNCPLTDLFVSFFSSSKVERSCGQTVKDRHDFSIILCQLYLLHHQNTSRRTSNFLWVFFRTPQVDPFVKFYCIVNILVRPNLNRWSGFDVLIIFGVKFWWFSFIWNLSSPSGSWVKLHSAKGSFFWDTL